MSDRPLYVSRILRLPLVSADGAAIGKIDDVVLLASSVVLAPRVIGFVAIVQRRRIFVNAARVGELTPEGARLRSGNVNLRRFEQRPGELRARELLDRRAAEAFVVDLAIEPIAGQPSAWHLVSVALGRRRGLRGTRNPRIVPWTGLPELFAMAPIARAAAALRDLHPSDAAQRVRDMPEARRVQLAAVMEDQHLAEVLQELPEDEQVIIIESLDVARAASVIEFMEPDDAADLLGELTEDDRTEILAAMDDEEATPLRRLLSYAKGTAGGLMTSDPVILASGATVADALRILDQHRPHAAMLDVNLGDGTAYPVAERLHELGIPFVFATGYGLRGLDPRWVATTVLQKPFDARVLAAALRTALNEK